jgi:hypothetical protein
MSMKAGILCVLLLAACSDDGITYDYSVTWTCLSAEGCERLDELGLYDRLNILDDTFVFASSRREGYLVSAQRFGSESLPAGCFWLYGLALFGDESEPAKVCRVSGGLDMEIAIPDRNPATHSLWLARARELGWL